METSELIELWKDQDPELDDIDGLRAFIELRASLNTIIMDKATYKTLTVINHLSKTGEVSFIFDDIEMLVNVKGRSTGDFTVPVPALYFIKYDISEAIELTDIVSAKLLMMLTETKKNADRIEINMTSTSIYIYATFENGSRFSYEIDINAEEMSLRNNIPAA